MNGAVTAGTFTTVVLPSKVVPVAGSPTSGPSVAGGWGPAKVPVAAPMVSAAVAPVSPSGQRLLAASAVTSVP